MDKKIPNDVLNSYIEHDPDGPYAFNEKNYPNPLICSQVSNLATSNSGISLPMRYHNVVNLLENHAPGDPFLLMVFGWLCLQMLEHGGGLKTLMDAQKKVGIGGDPLVDRRIEEIKAEVESLVEKDRGLWGVAREGDEIVTLWKPFSPFGIESGQVEKVRESLDKLRKRREGVVEKFGVERTERGYLSLAAIDTNEIEGVFYIDQDSRRQVIAHGIHPDTSLHFAHTGSTLNSRDTKTVVNIAASTYSAFESAKAPFNLLTLDDILHLHTTVLKHSCINFFSELVLPGTLRSYCVQICTPKKDNSGDFIVQVCPPWKVHSELTRLVNDINTLLDSAQNDDARILAIAIWAHNAFENIHPFSDGNGRVGRLLATMVAGRIEGGVAPMTIAPEPEDEYEDYIESLELWEKTGDLEASIESYFKSAMRAYDVVEEVLADPPERLISSGGGVEKVE